MSWYELDILSVFVTAAIATLSKVVLSGKNKIDYYTMSFLLCVFTAISLLVYVLLTKFTLPPLHSLKYLVIINIVAGLIGQLTFQKGLSELNVGEFTILMTTRQIITWIASIIFLSAGLTLSQGIGSILILVSIIVVFSNKLQKKNNSKIGVIFTLLTALNWGFAFLIDLLIYRRSDPASYLLIAYPITAGLLYIMNPKVLKHSVRKITNPKLLLSMAIIGLFSALSNILLFTALKRANNAPLVSGLYQIQIIVSVVFGLIFLKERKSVKGKLIGAALSTSGAILMVIR